MARERISRRGLLAAGAVAGVGAARALAAEEAAEEAKPADALQAIERLKAGNRRFVAGESIHYHANRDWRKRLTKGQHPFATILGCADSRVPVEFVFDQGFGDLFVIRIAGNIIAEDVVGSIQYASRHLGTKLYVVMGHEGCGAVTAAVDSLLGKLDEPEHIASLAAMITPGLANLDRSMPREKLISAAVEANVFWSMRQLGRLPEAQKAMRGRTVELVGAVYDLETGAVRLLKTPPGLYDAK